MDDTQACDAPDEDADRALANLRLGIERAREQVRTYRRVLTRDDTEES